MDRRFQKGTRSIGHAHALERLVETVILPGYNLIAMKQPNFFIIGAPKCATTSLDAWLSEHPSVYVSPLKEPYHFNSDHAGRRTQSVEVYNKVFANAYDPIHLGVGEASV